jgi:hypothetical protein
MAGRLAVTRKGKYVGCGPLRLHQLQASLESLAHLLARRELQFGAMVGIEATLAVYAVKRAEFAIGRKKIDAERNA